MNATVLILPGLHDSGPRHWQTLWEREHAHVRRVIQDDWETPRRADWIARLDQAVSETPSAILAAHSLGCALVAHWARVTQHSVRGALLVAPADVDRPGASEAATGFAPMPLERLPFRTIVVASRNDPHVTPDRARHFAAAWGSRFVEIGEAGHISDSFGGWPEGLALIEELAH